MTFRDLMVYEDGFCSFFLFVFFFIVSIAEISTGSLYSSTLILVNTKEYFSNIVAKFS